MIADRSATPGWRERGPLAIVGIAVLFSAVLLRHDLFSVVPEKTDRVLHDGLVRACAASWDAVFPPDFWFHPLTGGYPMFAHYQPLSHLIGAALARWTGSDPVRAYHALSGVLLILVPSAVYVSLRRLGLSRWGCAITAALYPLVRTRPYFGIGWESYLTAGSGLLPQLWSTFFMFPALAWGWAAIRGGGAGGAAAVARRVVPAALLMATCALSHTIFGYGVALSLVVAACIPGADSTWRGRLARLAAVGLGTALLTAWFAVPLVSLSGEALRSQWEFAWKWNSIGVPAVLAALARGELFDALSAVPVVSMLVAAGLLVSAYGAVRRADPLSRFAVAAFVLWVMLFGGRATWGRLIDAVLPLSSGLHMHRFVAMVQAFGMIALAIGVDAAVRRARASVGARRVGVVAGALAVAALAVPVVERVRFVHENDAIASARRTAVAADHDLAAAIAHLSALPPGRVYAGLHNDWGASAQVADIPLYSLVQSSQLDVVGYPFAAMAFPAEWLVRADFSRRDHLDLFGARWILAPEGAPVAMTAVPRQRFGSLVVLEIPESGYFDVGRVERIAAARPFRSWTDVYEAGRTWMFGSGPSEGRYAAFLAAPPPPITGEVRGRVEDERVAPGRFGATVTMETHGDVILKATKHPWWRCAVDDVPARITPVFPGFQSVRLTPGKHRVEFAYAPPAWKKGLFAAAVVLALAGLAWLVIDRVRS